VSAKLSVQDLQFEFVPSAFAASMDSSLDLGGLDFFQQSKGNFLYFTTTANSIMDYLTKLIKDDVVDSLPNCNHIPHVVSPPSLIKVKSKAAARILSSIVDSRSFQKLYDSPSASIPKVLVKEYFVLTFVYNIAVMGIVYADTLLDCP
jgi:hypothetical protein